MGVVLVDVGGAAVVAGVAGRGTFATRRVNFVEVDKTICHSTKFAVRMYVRAVG